MTSPRLLDMHGNEMGMGGGFEGASRLSREVALWQPSMGSADSDLATDKGILDARSRDMDRNDGLAHGATQIHRDSIVGAHFKLNAKPNWKVLGLTEDWAEEFQETVEALFTLYADSPENWIDASRMNTLTSMVRLAVGAYTVGGEVLASLEWIREGRRPFSTAVQMVDPDRMSNPRGIADTPRMRRGVEKNRRGAPVAFHIRNAHPGDHYFPGMHVWKRVAIRKPWGRTQMIHILEQHRVDQTRGIGDMVSVLKEMRMTKKFKDITLQSAVLNATYAAAIESDLPPEQAFDAIGGGDDKASWASNYLTQIADYTSGSKNMHIDGVKIPHLFPGTKLKMLTAGEPGGVGTAFEESLLRHISSGLGLSYEQFSRDYTKTNYSSARASMGETFKFMQSRKTAVADRFATAVYWAWLEEAINSGEVPLPSGAPNFYEGLNKEAYGNCNWIGQGRGQIDELKETTAAIARIEAGLSTYEKECSRFGDDFRDTLEQVAREQKLIKKLNIKLTLPGDKEESVGASGDNEKSPRKSNGKFGNDDEIEEEGEE